MAHGGAKSITSPRHYRNKYFDIIAKRKNAYIIAIFGFFILIVSLYAAKFVIFDYSLSGMLPKSHAVTQGNEIIDTNMAGMVPIEISFLGKENDFLNPKYISLMEQVGHWLKGNYPVSSPISIAGLIKKLNMEFNDSTVIPADSKSIFQILTITGSNLDKVISQLITDDYSHARMRTSIADIGAKEIVHMADRFNIYSKKLFKDTGITVRMTGEAPVAYRGMNRLSKDLILSILIALMVIIMAIGLGFRSMHLAIASFLPNILPVSLGLAFFALTNEVIDPLPGIAFCISIGISVDNTIHLIAKYREELSNDATNHEAIRASLTSLRGPLICSTCVLMGGFTVLLFSSFPMNQMLGGLCLALIFLAFLCDIIFTPAILNLMPSDKIKPYVQ